MHCIAVCSHELCDLSRLVLYVSIAFPLDSEHKIKIMFILNVKLWNVKIMFILNVTELPDKFFFSSCCWRCCILLSCFYVSSSMRYTERVVKKITNKWQWYEWIPNGNRKSNARTNTYTRQREKHKKKSWTTKSITATNNNWVIEWAVTYCTT